MSQCVIAQLPILERLSKAKPAERKRILKSASPELIQSIVECIENVLEGNVKIRKSNLRNLKKFKNILRKIIAAGRKLSHKKKVIIQSGGSFLPALLVPVISILVQSLLNS